MRSIVLFKLVKKKNLRNRERGNFSSFQSHVIKTLFDVSFISSANGRDMMDNFHITEKITFNGYKMCEKSKENSCAKISF